MSEYDDHAGPVDPVDAVVLAFLDHLEGVGPRPALDHLPGPDRARAAAQLDGLTIARGLDPYRSRPTVEALLADTPLAPLLPALRPAVAEVDPRTLCTVLSEVDSRARVEIDGADVVFGYLDLRARFLLVAAATPVVDEEVRAAVRRRFDADPDTSRVGVVAAGSAELLTQLLAADEIGDTITTPRGEPHVRWEPVLPLALAARRMLEQSAPEWPGFDFDETRTEALDVTGIAAEIARRLIAQESGRAYRGDKRRAYQKLVGREQAFADLVARVAVPGAGLDLDAELIRIMRAAA
jgi:hypothetical protein